MMRKSITKLKGWNINKALLQEFLLMCEIFQLNGKFVEIVEKNIGIYFKNVMNYVNKDFF